MLFVFKLSEGLDEKPTVEYYGPDGRPIGGSYKSYLTHREILEHCLKVFHAQDPKKCPTIMLIGTHSDNPKNKLKNDDLKNCLKSFRQQVIHFGSDQPIARLDCLSSGNEDKEIVAEVRKQILQVVDNMETEDTPMAWFGLELALKQASQIQNSKTKGILTLKQCQEEADKFEYFKDNIGQFDAALEHLVKHNIFLHYKVLPDVVFCDPQVLLTMVSQIVQYHYKLKHDSQGSVIGTEFVENAYISADILKSILSQYKYKDGIFPPESFLILLLSLKIISPVHTSDNSDKYLMPALLSNIDNPAEKVKEIHGEKHLAPLCISFDGGCAPFGLFCSLMVTLLKNGWELCMNNEKPCCLFRNCISFSYQRDTIALVDFYSHFSMYLYIPSHCNTEKVSLLLNMIHACIKQNLQCSTLKFQYAIRCPSHQDNHLAKWHLPEPSNKEEYYKCAYQNACTGPIPPEYHIWQEGML